MKYPPPLHDAVCLLVARLEQIPADEEIRIEGLDGDDAAFVVGRTGAEIARLPISLARRTDDPSP